MFSFFDLSGSSVASEVRICLSSPVLFISIAHLLAAPALPINSRNSDPGSRSRLSPPPPLRYVLCNVIARRVRHYFWPSSTLV